MATPPGTTAPAPTPAPASLGKQPVIFTMPEKYRDGAQPMAAPKPAAPVSVPMPAPVQAPAAVKPPPPKPPSGKPVLKRKSNTPKVLVIVGLLLIVILAVGAFFLLRTPAPSPIPEPLPIPEPTPTPIPEPTPEPTGPVSGTDTDGDGLTDLEEQIVYQSDPANPDTDQDGYPDALEVENFYNPAAIAPKTLFEAGKVRAYVHETDGYSMLYPSVWTVNEAADGSVVFNVSTGETVTFRAVFPGEVPAVDAIAFTTKNGLQAYRPARVDEPFFLGIPEGDLTLFVTTLGLKTTVDYQKTIDMIVNSFMTNR